MSSIPYQVSGVNVSCYTAVSTTLLQYPFTTLTPTRGYFEYGGAEVTLALLGPMSLK